MRGSWEDYAIHPDGRRVLVGKGDNLVVNSASVALAMCMKDVGQKGFMYWAIGDGGAGGAEGTADWNDDVENEVIVPVVTDVGLAGELFRKEITAQDIKFIDALDAESVSPTNRVEIRVLFRESEPSGDGSVAYLREWGIFGGTATEAPGSGMLINRKVHATHEKSTLSQLERILRFTF